MGLGVEVLLGTASHVGVRWPGIVFLLLWIFVPLQLNNGLKFKRKIQVNPKAMPGHRTPRWTGAIAK